MLMYAMTYKLEIWLYQKRNTNSKNNFLKNQFICNYTKNMLPMITIVG